MDAIKIEWTQRAGVRTIAVNADNGMIVGEIIHAPDRVVYESHMPKSKGEQWVFVSEEKAKEWVEKRYSGSTEGKTAAPKFRDLP